MNGSLTITGSLTTAGRKKAVAIKTTDYTITDIDEVIVCNKATAMTITLPIATGSGQSYYINNVGAGTITVSKSGDTINGETSQEVGQWETIELIDYGNNQWSII